MKILRYAVWGIIVILFTLLASNSVVWATPEQNLLNQTIPTRTPVATAVLVATAVVVGTPTGTPIPLLPPSGGGAQGNGFFILTGIFLAGSALVLLLGLQWRRRQGDKLIR